ncbi:MAG: hypothetical protein ACWA5T_08665 [Parvularcula sp.]
MVRSFAIATALLAVSACATVATFTIENRLQELGLSQRSASCMADELDQQLNDRQLTDFARFTVTLTKRDNPLLVLDSLKSINDPDIQRAVATSGLICIIRG